MSNINLKLVTDIELDGVDTQDYPDFADAFISSAYYNGVEMTDQELDQLNSENLDFVHEKVFEHFFG